MFVKCASTLLINPELLESEIFQDLKIYRLTRLKSRLVYTAGPQMSFPSELCNLIGLFLITRAEGKDSSKFGQAVTMVMCCHRNRNGQKWVKIGRVEEKGSEKCGSGTVWHMWGWKCWYIWRWKWVEMVSWKQRGWWEM